MEPVQILIHPFMCLKVSTKVKCLSSLSPWQSRSPTFTTTVCCTVISRRGTSFCQAMGCRCWLILDCRERYSVSFWLSTRTNTVWVRVTLYDVLQYKPQKREPLNLSHTFAARWPILHCEDPQNINHRWCAKTKFWNSSCKLPYAGGGITCPHPCPTYVWSGELRKNW